MKRPRLSGGARGTGKSGKLSRRLKTFAEAVDLHARLGWLGTYFLRNPSKGQAAVRA